MSFIAAGEVLGAAARVRTLTIAHHAELPDGTYAMVETYCTNLGCDCRKTMILVHLDHRHVSTIDFGWETPEFYACWYGAPLDARTRAGRRQLSWPEHDVGPAPIGGTGTARWGEWLPNRRAPSHGAWRADRAFTTHQDRSESPAPASAMRGVGTLRHEKSTDRTRP